ncbi:hypothetical protein [Citrobacter phage Tr1]|nr:hypothetical protein [Citrobacter phage Tr1]
MTILDILIFMMVFFATPLVVLIFTLESGDYKVVNGWHVRKSKEEIRWHWIKMFIALLIVWVVIAILVIVNSVIS